MNDEQDGDVRILEISPDDTELVEAVRELLREYHGWLDGVVCATRLTAELDTLPVPYVPPAGALFLALAGGEAVGCIGLRPHHDESCEMKRLYVTPQARGTGLGRRLVERAIDKARELGYADVLLSTIEHKMETAVAVYREIGFEDTESFRDLSGVAAESDLTCMRLRLR